MTRIALYPGSFDPITFGHIDIIKRAAKLTDKLIIGVGHNIHKKNSYLLSIDEKVEAITLALYRILPSSYYSNIKIIHYDGLLIDFAKSMNANLIIRGIRALSDFDFEFNLAGGNQMLNPNIESVFLMASVNQQFISSSMVKEIYNFGGDITKFVPKEVIDIFHKKYVHTSKNSK